MRAPPSDLLGRLRAEWRWIGTRLDARRAVDRLRLEHPSLIPRDVVDLHDLVSSLEPDGGLTQVHRARIVAALLDGAADPLVQRCLLQTLLPGIVATARRLQFGAGICDDPSTFLADALTEATELFSAWCGQQRRYAAPDLLNALRCRLRRRMLAEKRRRAELADDDRLLDRATGQDEDLAALLARALDEEVTDVDLLYARCVLEIDAATLAAAIGVSTTSLARRVAAAATALIDAST